MTAVCRVERKEEEREKDGGQEKYKYFRADSAICYSSVNLVIKYGIQITFNKDTVLSE